MKNFLTFIAYVLALVAILAAVYFLQEYSLYIRANLERSCNAKGGSYLA